MVSQLQAAFADVEVLYLADGHHRLASLESATAKRRGSDVSSNSVVNNFDEESSFDDDIVIEVDAKQ